jgi:3-keto-5-aminohexanoate cleavage enzyme
MRKWRMIRSMSNETFRRFSKEKVMVMSAPNGARRGRSDHLAIPITAEQSAKDATALLDAGVSILHLHVRDDDGNHSLDVERYRQAIATVRHAVGDELVIQVTTEAVGEYTSEQQVAVVRALKPEAVSLALREICSIETEEKIAAAFFEWMRGENIWPQYILYSVDDVLRFDDMRQRGIFADDAPFVMFVSGEYANAIPGTVADLNQKLAATDPDAYPWAVCCFGQNENEVMLAATELGGHVRLGFENNLRLKGGELAADNAALIRQYLDDNSDTHRRPATAAEVRATFIQESL